VRDETSRDIVVWSFIISSSRFTPPNATLIMPATKGKQAKGKQAEKPAEAQEKTIPYLLVDHEGKLSFGNLAELVAQADIRVCNLMQRIKEEKPNDLRPFDAIQLEPWTYKHTDFSSDTSFEKLQEIVGRIKFLKAGKNLKNLSAARQKMANIDLPEDAILLVRVPPLRTADTAGGGDGESFIRLAPTQHV
jgi:hypothetical protein